MRCLPLLASLLLPGLGCVRKLAPHDTVEGEPPIPLEVLRPILSTEIEDALAPSRLARLDGRNLTFLLDTEAGRVHALDPFLRHESRSRCLDVTGWEGLSEDIGARRGRCAEGQVELHRGWVQPDASPLALAVDEEELVAWILTEDGGLLRSDADALGSEPFDWLAWRERFDGPRPASGGALLAAEGGRLWIAEGTLLHELVPGTPGENLSALPGPALDLLVEDGVARVAVGTGLFIGGILHATEAPPARIVPDGEGGLWVSFPTLGGIGRWRPDGPTLEVRGDLGATGPLAVDTASGRLHVAVDGGVRVLDASAGGGEIAFVETGEVLDLTASESHEVLLLLPGGVVELRSDETALLAGAPLDLLVATFIERPRAERDDVPCGSAGVEGETLHAFLATARQDRAMMDELPASFALGLTPWLVRRARECGLEEQLRDVARGPRVEAGVLFHDVPEGCDGDLGCYEAALAEEFALFEASNMAPGWSSGLSTHVEEGYDWVEALLALDVPQRYLFFGLSILPEVGAEDPRAKDAWPVDVDELSGAWRASTATDPRPGGRESGLPMYPGNNIPAFNLGHCAGLFLMECHRLRAGGGAFLKPEDMAVLDLSLRRALAGRGDGPSTWYFHLPDLGVYDYSSGCEHEDGRWTGEGCQASLLQAWLEDVDARFVANGLARWALPSGFGEP